MTERIVRRLSLAVVLGCGLAFVPSGGSAQTLPPPTLTQQGRLYDASDVPIVGTRDLTFKIWDGCTTGGGPFVKWTEAHPGVSFDSGYFSVQLGLGTPLGSVLTGGNASCGVNDAGQFARYLEITVGTDALSPKALIASVPYALVAADVVGGGAWLRGGNAGTVDGTDFLGTTDDKPLNIVANGARALRVEPNSTSPNIIAGYFANAASSSSVYGATISGGGATGQANRADIYGTVGGGVDNKASSLATISGGMGNGASGYLSTIGGGGTNAATAVQSTVGGGYTNKALGSSSVVAGGTNNSAGGDNSTVCGGFHNSAGMLDSTIGGGYTNTASGDTSTVAGGYTNQATGQKSTVGGGYNNIASGGYSTVAGGNGGTAAGAWSTVAGGLSNQAGYNYATVGGGSNNTASAGMSTIPGGAGNQTAANADYSLAAGFRAVSNQPGQFVWADSTDADFPCGTQDRFCVRATGGVHFVTSFQNVSGGTSTNNTTGAVLKSDGSVQFYTGYNGVGVQLQAGAGAWSSLSDRNAKDHVEPIRPEEILGKLMGISINTWRYKAEDAGRRHMGPMAQDFYDAYHLGGDDRYITTVDADGVALAAIQGLFELTQRKELALEQSIQARDDHIASLEARLARLENGAHPPEKHTWFPIEGSWIAIAGLALTGTMWSRRKVSPGDGA